MAAETSGASARDDAMPSSSDRRTIKRAHRRVMVRFGTSKAEKTAFTKNISETGMFIQTNTVFKPGTTIQIRFELADREFSMWARVVWAKKVPPELAHLLGCGMGICYIDPTPEWIELYRRWDKDRK